MGFCGVQFKSGGFCLGWYNISNLIGGLILLTNFKFMIKKIFLVLISVSALMASLLFVSTASASHSWGGYHWARTVNPFSLKLGDNVSANWDSYLTSVSGDWSVSNMLDTLVVLGGASPKTCKPVSGRVEVCNSKYGNNGWLGIASVWASGSHITQGTVKLNDTYFNTVKYNTPAWKKLVMCQEIGHTFGLGHQDEVFDNTNLGTCMDYTNDPSGLLYGQLSNELPNAHDYEQLVAVYTHLDSGTTISQTLSSNRQEVDHANPSTWGKQIRTSSDNRGSLYERDLGKGNKVFTFVTWAN